MNLHLTPELYKHRRGRFLAKLLNAVPIQQGEYPKNGILCMAGDQFQRADKEQQELFLWTRNPGCVLLLLPPFDAGSLYSTLDWECGFIQNIPVALDNDSIENLVSKEVLHILSGEDGSDSLLQWGDHSSHTRYYKAHSNSGMFAATVLPIWSITLMNHAGLLMNFMDRLYRNCGRKISKEQPEIDVSDLLQPEDITVLVCCYGIGTATENVLQKRIGESCIPIIDITKFNFTDSIQRLTKRGYLNSEGVTSDGLTYLQSTPYWLFAENLKGML